MATIETYALANGAKRYRVRYRTPEGKSAERAAFATKRDAQAFSATVEVSKLRGEYVNPSDAKITVGQLGPAWLARQVHLKPSALRPLEISWRVHVEPRWGTVPIGEIRFTAVEGWVAELSTRRGATVVIRAFGVLAGILDGAVKDRRMLTNPARGAKLPRKVGKEHIYLTHEQVWDLARASKKWGVLVLMLSYCGLRWSEAGGLRVRDLHLLGSEPHMTVVKNAVQVSGKIYVGTPKGHKQRTVPIPATVVEHLARQCEGKGRDDLVFPAPKGGHLKSPNGTRGWFERARVIAGLPRLTPHDLRHSAISLSVATGTNVKVLQRIAGHKSAAMTLDVYSGMFDKDLTVLAERLDEAMAAASVGFLWGMDPQSKGGTVSDLRKRAK